MEPVSDAEIAAAEARGGAMIAHVPRALHASYHAANGRVTIQLANECVYAFPAKTVQELAGASDADLAAVEVDGMGFNLHWPNLGVDLSVPLLLAGVFGTKAWGARVLASEAGRTKSPAKSRAARENGAKGGRPRKKAGA